MSGERATWSDSIEGRLRVGTRPGDGVTVGVLPGEGVGPEVTAAAETVLAALGPGFSARRGPPVMEREAGHPVLTADTVDFCRDVFAGGGAVLAGPHGGRWVYELRREFDLFCRLNPLQPAPEIGSAPGPVSPGGLGHVDVLIVREQSAGVYQGRWSETDERREGHVAEHSFAYSHREVQRILAVAALLARGREGRLAVVVKDGGVPSISRLWRRCADETAARAGIDHEILDVDYAAYRLVRDPGSFDVIVAPNLFGDVLSDVGAVLLGSRGLGYGGSFDAGRAAVYQTNHGAAFDLASCDRANPGAQILALAMMLRESFGMAREAALVERALAAVWRAGWRTDDLATPGSPRIGTAEMGSRVAEALAAPARGTTPQA